MGWKGAVRSAVATSKRAQVSGERRARARARLEAKAGATVRGLDAEVEKELRRIEDWEDAIAVAPIKALGLEYEVLKGWSTKAFEEKTGKITYSMQYALPSKEVAFAPPQLVVDGAHLTPVAITLSPYFTAVAWAATMPALDEAGTIKITFPRKPELNRIALVSPTGVVFSVLDSSLDGRIFAGTTRRGLVTFEPFLEPVEHFDLLIQSEHRARKGPKSGSLRCRSPLRDWGNI